MDFPFKLQSGSLSQPNSWVLVFPVSFLVFGCCRCSSPSLWSFQAQRTEGGQDELASISRELACVMQVEVSKTCMMVTSLSEGTADKLTWAFLWQTERFPWRVALRTKTELYCHHYGST